MPEGRAPTAPFWCGWGVGAGVPAWRPAVRGVALQVCPQGHVTGSVRSEQVLVRGFRHTFDQDPPVASLKGSGSPHGVRAKARGAAHRSGMPRRGLLVLATRNGFS